jgi:transmembrane sensor
MESSKQIEDIAANWLARRDGGDWSASDQVELDAWLQATTAHRVAYLRLEAAWKQTVRLKALAAGMPPGAVPAPGAWQASPFFDGRAAEVISDSAAATDDESRSFALYRAMAAVFLLGVAFAAGWFLYPFGGSSYHTEVGGLASVPLSDGSKVTLNTDSEIHVAVTEVERHVDLRQGEAYFEVAKDPSRPFVVQVGDKRVVAVGTKFSVRRTQDDIRVVVTEGRVRVEEVAGAGPEVRATELVAGTVARSDGRDTLVQEKPLVEVEEYLSWRSGYLVFRDMTLGDAVAEFNRYNTRKIVIEDPAVAAIRIGGHFRSTNVDALVRLLEQGFPIRASREHDQIILTSG